MNPNNVEIVGLNEIDKINTIDQVKEALYRHQIHMMKNLSKIHILSKDLKEELKKELKEELKEELKNELKEELNKELKEELNKELNKKLIPIRKELQLRKENPHVRFDPSSALKLNGGNRKSNRKQNKKSQRKSNKRQNRK